MMFVRTASERDIDAIRALLVETWHDTYDAVYGEAKVTEITDDWHSIRSLRARLTAPRSEFLVADDGKVLGGMAFAQADETGTTVTVRQIYVLPAMQGGGIGGMLLDEIEDSFPEARRFVLEVESANERAIRFYLSRGYIDVGVAEEHPPAVGAGGTVRRMELKRFEA